MHIRDDVAHSPRSKHPFKSRHRCRQKNKEARPFNRARVARETEQHLTVAGPRSNLFFAVQYNARLLGAIIKVPVISRVGRNRTRIVVSYKSFAILRGVWLTCNNPPCHWRAVFRDDFQTVLSPSFLFPPCHVPTTAFQASANSCSASIRAWTEAPLTN